MNNGVLVKDPSPSRSYHNGGLQIKAINMVSLSWQHKTKFLNKSPDRGNPRYCSVNADPKANPKTLTPLLFLELRELGSAWGRGLGS